MTEAEHLPVAVPAAPLRSWEGKQVHVCPGKPLTAAGKLPTLRRGSYRAPAAPTRYERRPEWGPIMFPAVEPEQDEIEIVAPPIVPARYTTSLDEIPRQAMTVGKKAAALGWQVDPWYSQAVDGTEASYLVLQRDELRAYAVWRKAPGATWRTDGAFAWILGAWPSAVGVKRLVDLIETMG